METVVLNWRIATLTIHYKTISLVISSQLIVGVSAEVSAWLSAWLSAW